MAGITDEDVKELREGLAGELTIVDKAVPRSPSWNGLLKGPSPYISVPVPAFIVTCVSPDDVSKAVQFGKAHNLKVYAKGSGRHSSGVFIPPAGVLVDLSNLKEVSIDPESRTATAQPGVTSFDLYRETAEYGLHFPAGNVSFVGISGFILGGGMGAGATVFGAGCDNVISMEVIDGTAAGATPRTVDAESDPDLFFGLRGAGAHLGIVTSFRLKLYPVSAQIPTSLLVYPVGRAKELYPWWLRWLAECPKEIESSLVFSAAHNDKEAVVMVASKGYSNSDKVLDALAAGHDEALEGANIVDHNSPAYLEALTEVDAAWGKPGTSLYSYGGFVGEVTDELLENIVAHILSATSPRSCIILSRTPAPPQIPNALGFRKKTYVSGYAVWNRTDAGAAADGDEAHVRWACAMRDVLRPAVIGRYANEMMFQPGDDPSACFEPATWERLQKLKGEYDPDNLFRPLDWTAPGAASDA